MNKDPLTVMTCFTEIMNNLLLLAISLSFLLPISSQSNTNYFGVGGVFEFDLGDREISLKPMKKE